jgi:CRP-like cAMP-binding protein
MSKVNNRKSAAELRAQVVYERDSDCFRCAVRASALFCKLGTPALDQTVKRIKNGVVRPDTVIYRSGDPARATFTVRNGLVKLINPETPAGPRIVSLMGRGAAIGLESIMADGVYLHTAITIRESNVCRIPSEVLSELKARCPELTEGLIYKWRDHARSAESVICTLCAGQLKQRATALLRYIVEVTCDRPEAVRLPRTSDMAEILGVSAESISRCMADLKRQGLIRRIAPWTYQCAPELVGAVGWRPRGNGSECNTWQLK